MPKSASTHIRGCLPAPGCSTCLPTAVRRAAHPCQPGGHACRPLPPCKQLLHLRLLEAGHRCGSTHLLLGADLAQNGGPVCVPGKAGKPNARTAEGHSLPELPGAAAAAAEMVAAVVALTLLGAGPVLGVEAELALTTQVEAPTGPCKAVQ